MYRKILVGYDGHEGGADALALGRVLAEVTGAEMLVASTYPRVAYHATVVAVGELEEQMRRETETVLDKAVRGVTAPGGVATRAVSGSSPAATLHRLAVQEGFDLVVLGSTSYGPVGRLLVGSTGNRILQGAPYAVAVTPRGHRERTATRFTKIGVGYDGSDESKLALRAATELARGAGAQLRLLSVVQPISTTWTFAPPAWQVDFSVDDLLHELVAQRNEEMRTVLAEIDEAVAAEGAVLTGHPAKELVTAAENDVDLLVVGSRAYGPLRRVLLGGVSFKLMRSAPCPLLIVPRGTEQTGEGAEPEQGEVAA